ncbi:prepilin-type N-terminal cleavage/methylation domain-containing protein [Variovorax beijingensis]|uniref:Type II secretion system protein H n=1 Tax=Variovorax beijingensis TaxID=2496117 RepID=A0A3P3EQ31_9BURK|nr:GspH/FimT family pseudopilin [Variovorax beijingensis]RRH88176.1 prepilin-type N-terminal cleavage/methylation domain-containing protein [Variovorax beijingensis]
MSITMRQRGFTLVELIVTIAVLALILFAVMPSIGTWLENTRIRNVADSLQNGLQLARGEAVRRNQNVSLWLVSLDDPAVLSDDCSLSGASGAWIVSVNSPIGHCADAPSTTSSPMIVTGRPVGDTGGRVTVAAVQAADGSTEGTSVTFNGFGRIANSDAIGQIDVTGTTAGTRALRIVVSPSGSVRMCEPAIVDSTAKDPRKC